MKKGQAAAIGAVGLLWLVACCGGRLFGADSNSQAESVVAVPDLVGDAMNTVSDQLESAGLEGSASDAHGSSDWSEKSVVLRIKPAAGTRVARGSTVTIVEASKGEIAFYSKPMPDLRGSMWLEINSGPGAPVDAYISYSWRDARGREKPGSIVAQKPAPGKRMKFGMPIKLTVANLEYQDSGSGSGPSVPDINWPNPCRHSRWC
ncbi:PASTA domain-containing protein [Actinoplanes sp. HUAS TT8]|uniref:PASTA domain-containing protein n=1 Tax=Actinoplanes sp. HUAS TT8 TaxID=3447453 RepID=UPI003F51E692